MQQQILKVDVILGSLSDLRQARGALEFLAAHSKVRLAVHIISCHRNPLSLLKYASWSSADVIIAGAGKAAALPGVLKAWLSFFNRNVPVLGVAIEGTSKFDNDAARLSISQLPGTPVLMDIISGDPFFGKNGFLQAAAQASRMNILEPREPYPDAIFLHFPEEKTLAGKEAVFNLNWKDA